MAANDADHAAAGQPGRSIGNLTPEDLHRAMRRRADTRRIVRQFFGARDFLEVDTPRWVAAPGTDVHLDPLKACWADRPGRPTATGYLHTSPEFAMKRLLADGFDRIWQMCKVWRNGEVGPRHIPEFSLLEWYRAGEPVAAIIDDVEALVRRVLGELTTPDGPGRPIGDGTDFERLTMQTVVDQAMGFDLLDALEFDALIDVCGSRDLLSAASLRRARQHRRWDEVFFELQINHIDPFLAERGPIFVTEWPAPLAILARTKPGDPRVAQRFELYVDGVELANGFQELTDPAEQRRRFRHEADVRRRRGLPELPLPDKLLAALERGMPASSGVAVGVDRLLMVAAGADDIRQVAPFGVRRAPDTGTIVWG